MLKSKTLAIAFLAISFLGFLDATYLAIEHYRGVTPPCTFLEGCEQAMTSKYATLLGVPVALGGSAYYLTVFILTVLFLQTGNGKFFKWASWIAAGGFLASLWFLYLQLFVIKALCIYCVFSFVTSTVLFGLGLVGRTRKTAQ